ncbi:MAG: putative toxin-antitoxin system toxin component, PIN family [Candidatus Doudnabacteria bacterium]|nr:putative toxin-antitoxin system toxin component, PIN family [Candidatus Doudnabacteria bacterium]
MTKEVKVVIDTNILINASADESSYAFRIVKEVIEGRIEAFATHQMMSENRQMLRKLVKDRKYKELLENFFTRLKIVKIHNSPPPSLILREGAPPLRVRGGWEELLSDKDDLKLFESALVAKADYIISEDKEVLAVENYAGTEAITPKDFWTKYQGEKDGDSEWRDFSRMILGK